MKDCIYCVVGIQNVFVVGRIVVVVVDYLELFVGVVEFVVYLEIGFVFGRYVVY